MTMVIVMHRSECGRAMHAKSCVKGSVVIEQGVCRSVGSAE